MYRVRLMVRVLPGWTPCLAAVSLDADDARKAESFAREAISALRGIWPDLGNRLFVTVKGE